MVEKIILVDEQDKIIGSKERAALTETDVHRISALWLRNSKGEVLLAQRKFTKKHDPGKWGPAVAGTNAEGETYESNIIKETEEEIGLTDFKPIKSLKKRHSRKHAPFVQWFEAIVDKDISEFKLQDEEVEQIKWVDEEEFRNDLKENPSKYVPAMDEALDL